jgi:molecular chaperone DnaK
MYLGIDLGTTNSAVAGVLDGKVRLFKTADGADVLPSVIYVDKRGHRLYGKRAYEQVALSPENVARGFKRLMGTSTEIEFEATGRGNRY